LGRAISYPVNAIGGLAVQTGKLLHLRHFGAAWRAPGGRCERDPQVHPPCAGYRFWRRLMLPKRIDAWSLTSLQRRLVKTGARLVKHARFYWLLLAEGHPHRCLFDQMLQRIWALPVPSG